MALFSFVQSINTTLGTSVFEEVGKILATPHFKNAEAQYKDLNFKMLGLVSHNVLNCS